MATRFKLLWTSSIAGIGGTIFAVHSRQKTATCSEASSSQMKKDGEVNDELSLKLVQVFFRHGARTPLKHLPGVPEATYEERFLIGPVPHAEVPYDIKNLVDGGPRPADYKGIQMYYAKTKFKGGTHAGSLTKIGKDQGYNLGLNLKKDYIDNLEFLSPNFKADDIFLRTTNMSRTVETLECVVAGMYKSSIKEPIRMFTCDKFAEILYPNRNSCKCLRESSDKVQQELNNSSYVANIKQKIISHIGEQYKNEDFDFMQWRDHVIARKTQGLPVPAWMDTMLSDFEEIAVLYMKTATCGFEEKNNFIALSAGPMLNMVKEFMEHTLADSKEKKKLCLYSCHDSTLTPLLVSLSIYDEAWPPYAADLRIELYENKRGQHFVKMLYCGKEMVPRGHDVAVMTYDQFLALIKPYALNKEEHVTRCKHIPKFISSGIKTDTNKIKAKPEKEVIITGL